MRDIPMAIAILAAELMVATAVTKKMELIELSTIKNN